MQLSRIDFRNEYVKTKIEIETLQERLEILKGDKDSYDQIKHLADDEVAKLLMFGDNNRFEIDEIIKVIQSTIALRRDGLKRMDDFLLSVAKHLRTFTDMKVLVMAFGTDMDIYQIMEATGYTERYVKKIISRINKEL